MRAFAATTIITSLAILGAQAAPVNESRLAARDLPEFLKSWKGFLCGEGCRKFWGWGGRVMGGDRWGPVLHPGKPSAIPTSLYETPSATETSTVVRPTSSSLPTLILPSSSVPVDVPSSSSFVVETVAPSSSVAAPSSSDTPREPSSSQAPVEQPTTVPEPSVEPEPEQPETTQPPQQEPEPQPEPEPEPENPPQQEQPGGVSAADIALYLAGHNSIRALHGANALTWSNDLSAKAQEWANRCVFEHSGGSLGPFGENLAAGTGAYSITSAVKAWTDEVSEYNPSNPVPSHFTQVVWKATTQVGCAVATCNGIFDASFGPAQYYVCEYSPAGNVIGQFAQNVQA